MYELPERTDLRARPEIFHPFTRIRKDTASTVPQESPISVGRRGPSRGPSLPLRIVFLICLLALLPSWTATRAYGAEGIDWAPSFELALEQARTEKKIVMVDFFTHWCHWCKVLDEKTYSDPDVIEASKKMVNVKVNAGTYVEIARKYSVTAYPTILFLNPDGSVRMTVRGFQPPERFRPQMESARAVGGQLFAVKNQLADHPDQVRLHQQYIELLTLDGQWAEAAAETEALLQTAGSANSEERASWTLDALIYRLRAGQDVRRALENWRKENRNHPRELEARYQLAWARESAGDGDDARKGYESVQKDGGKSWLGTAAEARLRAMKEPGPKGT